MNEELTKSLISLREIKAMREIQDGKQARLEQTPWEKATLPQPEEMDTQGGSGPDDLSFHLRNGKWRKRS